GADRADSGAGAEPGVMPVFHGTRLPRPNVYTVNTDPRYSPTISMTSSDSAGSLFVVAAPSGAGKTSLVRALLADRPLLQLSVSFPTRAPRAGEMNGRDYHFIDRDEFERRREAGDFLEWAEVHGNLYATSRRWIEERIRAGVDIVLEIDWQ